MGELSQMETVKSPVQLRKRQLMEANGLGSVISGVENEVKDSCCLYGLLNARYVARAPLPSVVVWAGMCCTLHPQSFKSQSVVS